MVITKLIGGLGNQMFQYATARCLAITHGTTLKLDITAFESYKLRAYALGHLNIHEEFAKRDEIASLLHPGRIERLAQKFLNRVPSLRVVVAKEKQIFKVDPEIAEPFGRMYLDGYWQNEEYFKSIGNQLREEFRIRTSPDAVSAEVAKTILNACAVSVHVRRGDYVTNLATTAFHGVCSIDYYEAALRIMFSELKSPHFFVFSDDPQWVQENLRFPDPVTFVTHNNADRNYEDLRMMSLCHHHIIANSSFSWWGAWLGRNPSKIVIAPKRWMGEGIDSDGIIPQEWRMI